MRASIVIATHNEGDRLWKTVNSCVETIGELDYEIVVADSSSTDGSVEELMKRFPQVRLFRSRERTGTSPTKEKAASKAHGDVLVFMDAHCKPEPEAIERLVTAVEELNGQAIILPRIAFLDSETWENNLQQVVHTYSLDLISFELSWIEDKDQLRTTGRFYESPSMSGCCFAISRLAYEKLWGFDAEMRCWGIEDIDLGLKAWLMGYKILHDPVPLVGHRFQASFDNYSVTMEDVLYNKMRMARKNYSDTVWEDWQERFRAGQRIDKWTWQIAWAHYQQSRKSIEREREYLFEHRIHDELWFADYFDLH